MTQAQQQVAFAEDAPRTSPAGAVASPYADEDLLLINIDGYEGPLDILLELAKRQKVDIARLSILQLVRQYLAFIDRAKVMRLELAADYLVMAAWLAYLKSRLLLPQVTADDEDPLSAEAMAAALQFQLRRLEAIQKAARALEQRPRLGQQIFARGSNDNDGLATELQISYSASLFDLLSAYGDIRQRNDEQVYELPRFTLMSMDEAMQRLTTMLGRLPKAGREAVWTTLQSFAPDTDEPLFSRSSMASLFTAGLELAKQGAVQLRQETAFSPIYLRALADMADKAGRANPSEEFAHEEYSA